MVQMYIEIDDQAIIVHRMLLSHASPVISEKFAEAEARSVSTNAAVGDDAKKAPLDIGLDNDAYPLRHLVHWLYTGKLCEIAKRLGDYEPENLLALLRLASKYDCPTAFWDIGIDAMIDILQGPLTIGLPNLVLLLNDDIETWNGARPLAYGFLAHA